MGFGTTEETEQIFLMFFTGPFSHFCGCDPQGRHGFGSINSGRSDHFGAACFGQCPGCVAPCRGLTGAVCAAPA